MIWQEYFCIKPAVLGFKSNLLNHRKVRDVCGLTAVNEPLVWPQLLQTSQERRDFTSENKHSLHISIILTNIWKLIAYEKKTPSKVANLPLYLFRCAFNFSVAIWIPCLANQYNHIEIFLAYCFRCVWHQWTLAVVLWTGGKHKSFWQALLKSNN